MSFDKVDANQNLYWKTCRPAGRACITKLYKNKQ
jgi:hypothetical protein